MRVTIPNPDLNSNIVTNNYLVNCGVSIDKEGENQYLGDLKRYSKLSDLIKKYKKPLN